MKRDASAQGAKARKKSKPAQPATTKAPPKETPSEEQSRAAAVIPGPLERQKPLTAWSNTQIWLLSFGATIVATAGVGLVFGPASGVLVLAAFAFISVIALFWTSLRTLLGETPIESADAFAIGAPRVEEEQKRAVLRALKDLEFERGVGKISEADYKVLVAQYRAEAKRLLRQLDERGAANRRRAEMMVAERFVVKGPAAKPTAKDENDPDAPARALESEAPTAKDASDEEGDDESDRDESEDEAKSKADETSDASTKDENAKAQSAEEDEDEDAEEEDEGSEGDEEDEDDEDDEDDDANQRGKRGRNAT